MPPRETCIPKTATQGYPKDGLLGPTSSCFLLSFIAPFQVTTFSEFLLGSPKQGFILPESGVNCAPATAACVPSAAMEFCSGPCSGTEGWKSHKGFELNWTMKRCAQSLLFSWSFSFYSLIKVFPLTYTPNKMSQCHLGVN